MTLTIDLPPEVLDQLQERAAREGGDAASVAASLLLAALDQEPSSSMDPVAAIQEGLADVADGRMRPLSDFIADQRSRHSLPDLPDNWQGAAELL